MKKGREMEGGVSGDQGRPLWEGDRSMGWLVPWKEDSIYVSGA